MLFAVFLPSKSSRFCKNPVLWCQERDLNSRPPAYETNTKCYLKTTTKALNTANWLYYIKKIKNKTEYCTCFLLHYHQKKDKKGMIFAEFLPSKFFLFFTFSKFDLSIKKLFLKHNILYKYKNFLFTSYFKTINLYEYLFNTKTIFNRHLVSLLN